MLFKKNSFKVLEKIGEGLNAVVYKIEDYDKDYDLKKTYALKVLKRKEDLALFKKEFHNLEQASGKRLVKVLGWRRFNKKPALLLEYLEGLSLNELLKLQKLKPEDLSYIKHEINEGLLELEDSKLFHGDLSPNNVMVTVDGNIKLIDFGLSHWRTQQIEVTPDFASPEILKGDKPNYKSDLYSLNQIFSKLGLNEAPDFDYETAPKSLGRMVQQSLELLNAKTQTSSAKTIKSTRQLTYIAPVLLVFIICSLLYYIITLKTYSVFIRSPKWLAVKTKHSDWCYTPCQLKFRKLGENKVYWKSKTETGFKLISIKENNNPISINP